MGFKAVLGETIIPQRNCKQVCDQLHEFLGSFFAKIQYIIGVVQCWNPWWLLLEILDICSAFLDEF